MERTMIIAHRGAAGEAPENTLAAFQLAVEQKCDAIELDVHLTKDGELAVIHDDTVKRTTNGKGRVGDMTVKELKKLDAGLWFGESFQKERIPLLDEVFEVVPDHILINVEIKNVPSFYKGIEKKLYEKLVQYNRIENTIVSSFDHQCLTTMKKLENSLKIGLLYQVNLLDHVAYTKLFDFPIYSLHPHRHYIKKENITDAMEKGLAVYPWNVNKEKEMNDFLKLGISGIITDYPGKLYNLRSEASIPS
ncbi:glycerophosphodiester phosphodiesterase [Fictibacillus gelatini]|uniref:glycerophosphodiester phosphodiesterase n=1 Tax=Fictibacillus gelatini TaxID=225985 RepID=UPI0003F8350F|nr:glycerophosphodiester phosphodiesterase [Fictibacillus gelatini]